MGRFTQSGQKAEGRGQGEIIFPITNYSITQLI